MNYITGRQLLILILGILCPIFVGCSNQKDREISQPPSQEIVDVLDTQSVATPASVELQTIRFDQASSVIVPKGWELKVELSQRAMFGSKDDSESFILTWDRPQETRVDDILAALTNEGNLAIFETSAFRSIEEWVKKHEYSLQAVAPIKLDQLNSIRAICLEAEVSKYSQAAMLYSCTWDCNDYTCTGNYIYEVSSENNAQSWAIFDGIAKSATISTRWQRIGVLANRLTIRLPHSWEIQDNSDNNFQASWYDRMITLYVLGPNTDLSINEWYGLESKQQRVHELQEALKQDFAERTDGSDGQLVHTEPIARLQDNTFLVGIEAIQEFSDIDGRYFQQNIAVYYDCGLYVCFVSYLRIDADSFDEYDRNFLEDFIRGSVDESP